MKKSKLMPDRFRNKVMDVVFAEDYSPLTTQDLIKKLKIRGGDGKEASGLLNAMIASGDLVKDKKGFLTPGSSGRLLTGILRVFRSGDGLVENGNGEELFIRQEEMKNSLPGDKVVADSTTDRKRTAEERQTGRIIRILSRSKRALTGTVKKVRNAFYVVPMDSAYSKSFRVSDLKGALVDDRVVVQFSDWSDHDTHPAADIMEVIGSSHDPSFDTIAAVKHFNLPEEFSYTVIQEAEESAAFLDAPGERTDLRDKFIFTIDPASARDFDDAISLERDKSGNRVLGVHIADVAHFVKKGSELDKEAEKRGNSVYLPDMVIPMLPEHISNGLCSLRPDEDRLAFSVFMTVDNHGVVKKSTFTKSIIRSRLRLCYEEALTILDPSSGKKDSKQKPGRETVKLIRDVGELAQQLRKKRFEALALDFDVPDYDIVIGKDGHIENIKKVENDVSHQLIEECMVAANEAVDRELSERGYTTLRRIHEPPTKKRIDDLKAVLNEMGFKAGDLSNRKNMAAFLKSIKGHHLEYYVTVAVLKSMKRAEYSPRPAGHFGLAKTYYTHFTSPIRRYPDLVTHRILVAALAKTGNPYPDRKLTALGKWCSTTEQVAEQAEKAVVEIKKYRYLEQRIKDGKSDVYDAVVVAIMHFGVFVELSGIQVQGLLRFDRQTNAHTATVKGRKSLMLAGQRHGIGSSLKVIVASVDAQRKQLNLSPAETSGRTAGHRKKQKTGRKKRGR